MFLEASVFKLFLEKLFSNYSGEFVQPGTISMQWSNALLSSSGLIVSVEHLFSLGNGRNLY